MKWSLKIAQFKGIPVYINATFLLIIVWVALVHWMQDHSISATIQGMALVFGFLGFLVNPFLLIIAFFVWIGAAREAQMTKVKFAFDGIPVSNAMITDSAISAFNQRPPKEAYAQVLVYIRKILLQSGGWISITKNLKNPANPD